MEHTEWFEQTTHGDAVNAVASKAGLVQRTLARQLDRNRVDAENIIKIAAAYNIHPVRALVDTGYLDARYAKQVDPVTALRSVSEEQLADEVLRRMKKGMKTKALTTPIDELAARRSKTTPPDVEPLPYRDGTVQEWDDTTQYAADHSTDEQKERENRGEEPID